MWSPKFVDDDVLVSLGVPVEVREHGAVGRSSYFAFMAWRLRSWTSADPWRPGGEIPPAIGPSPFDELARSLYAQGSISSGAPET